MGARADRVVDLHDPGAGSLRAALGEVDVALIVTMGPGANDPTLQVFSCRVSRVRPTTARISCAG
ncbi:hypothetical protein BST47_26540 [Mycolicibacterium tusciae]|uniref:Uncharacterized protein n=1 Tax=Mycolicibacterium tusciae TaxID=75922 RepID=A0A1X0JGM3_9MYCO|nr:hypothetical protein BST47_26540 [Mycolicibacterium tusciae]